MSKTYNVGLSNKQVLFDSREGIASAREAVEYIIDRGGTYRVSIDAGDAANTLLATYHTEANSFDVMGEWGKVNKYKPDEFTAIIESTL